MPDVALCTQTMTRTDRLEGLLDSATDPRFDIDRVVVADNGKPSAAKAALFDRDWPFTLDVLEMEYDAGVGPSRDATYRHVREDVDYLIAADNDHRLSPAVNTLVDQLEAWPSAEDVGGIAANLIEPDEGRVWQSAKDFVEWEGSLVRTARREKEIEFIAGEPFVAFDFIPYPAVYRIDALDDYSWDSEYPLHRTHADFCVGHWKKTDWRFGINPAAAFYHYPGGDKSYTEHRRDEAKFERAEAHFQDKWGYDRLLGDRGHRYWFDTHE